MKLKNTMFIILVLTGLAFITACSSGSTEYVVQEKVPVEDDVYNVRIEPLSFEFVISNSKIEGGFKKETRSITVTNEGKKRVVVDELFVPNYQNDKDSIIEYPMSLPQYWAQELVTSQGSFNLFAGETRTVDIDSTIRVEDEFGPPPPGWDTEIGTYKAKGHITIRSDYGGSIIVEKDIMLVTHVIP